MTAFVPPASAQSQTPAYKIKRKPAPTLLSPITPITPLRAPGVTPVDLPLKATFNDVEKPVDMSNLSVVPLNPASYTKQPPIAPPRTISMLPLTDFRYPPPDPNDPFAPLSVLRDRSRRCSTNAMLSSYTVAAGSDGTGRLNDKRAGMASTDNLSVASSTKSSFMPVKAVRTLGVIRAFPNDFIKDKKKSEHSQKRTSRCSFELYPDPPSCRVPTDIEAFMTMRTQKKCSTPPCPPSRTPKSKNSTPTKTGALGHYTPHSRQRTQSSFSTLSPSSSPTFNLSNRKQHVLISAPDVHPLPSLVRDRSESSASGTSSSGTGYQSHNAGTAATTTPEKILPLPSASILSLGGSNASQFDVSDSYALTRTLLNSPEKHPYQSDVHARSQSSSSSRDSSPCRYGYEQDAKSEQTPKAIRTKEMDDHDMERATSPTGSMFKFARFFTGGKTVTRKNSIGSLRLLDGSPSSKVEKKKQRSPKSKISPPRGRARTRKLSVSSISISAPVSTPVSIPLGKDLRQPVEELPLHGRSTNRPRSQTTSELPPTIASRLRHRPYRPDASAKSSPVSVGAIDTATNTSTYVDELRIGDSDQDVEDEINMELNISRLKPWTASIPRKRSSLSLSILPIHMGQETREFFDNDCETMAGRAPCSVFREDMESSFTTFSEKSKSSRESAVSAGSIGSSYIHVVDSGGAKSDTVPTREEDYSRTWSRRPPLPPRSKTEGLLKSNPTRAISGIKFPGLRRAQTSNQDLIQGTTFPSTYGSVRGLKISSPMLQSTVSTSVKLASSVPLSMTSLALPATHLPTKVHGRAISNSGCSFLDQSVRAASPMNMDIPLDNENAPSNTRLPTTSELGTLLALPLLDENGRKVAFGDVLNTSEEHSGKTVIVLFIRHFWCPLDQDYVQEVGDILRRLSEEKGGWQLATSDGELRIGREEGKKVIPEVVIISNGSPALIAKYKEIFDLEGKKGSNLKIKMYTDPTCQTYSLLGMENVGEACINVTSKPSTPIPPSHKHTSTTPSPPESPMSSRGQNAMSTFKYNAGVPLARIDHRTPPKKYVKGYRKSGSLGPSASSLCVLNIERSHSNPPSPSAMLSTVDALEPALARSISPLSISSTHGSVSRSYVKHTSAIGGMAAVVLRAIKVGMPVWERGGAIKQLGGELVFQVMKERLYDQSDSEMHVACMFAHRMRDTQDHTPFGDVLKIALTRSPSNNYVSFQPSAAFLAPSSSRHSIYSLDPLSEAILPPYERSQSAPLHSHDLPRTSSSAPCSPSKHSRHRTQTDVHVTRTTAPGTVWWTAADDDEEALGNNFPEFERVMTGSVLDTLKDGPVDTWGDKLHTLRSRMAGTRDTDSLRGIRARDSIRSSTDSRTDSSIRAIRAIRVPRGPRMRMQSASAESLTASRSRDTVRSFGSGSGMEGIESVLEYGESISSPDLSVLGQLATGAGSPSENRWRSRHAMDSTSTLNSSLYYDAHEGLLEPTDNHEEENPRLVTVGVEPVMSRPASRLGVLNSPEVGYQTFDDMQRTNTISPDRNELTSVCSGTSNISYVEDADSEKLRELLVIRASSSLTGRGN